MSQRFIPSSFDPTDRHLAVVPCPASHRWESCKALLARSGAQTLLLRLPLFWQVLSPLYAICKETGTAIYPNEVENLNVGAAALSTAANVAVVTGAADAARFALYLQEKSIPLPKAWLLIHHPQTKAWHMPEVFTGMIDVQQEIHLFPGVPVLVQCEALARAKTYAFHASEGLLALQEKYTLPFGIRTIDDPCSCGKEILQPYDL